tara:strand:- start:799 stop:1788 length:990 start_codon:yes stop_codon:yes gene_type:complete
MQNKTSQRQVYWNGKFVPESEAKVSIYDSSLMFGDMVFEMTRSFNGTQWKLEEHIDRLFTGIKILRIPTNITKKEVYNAVLETIEKNKAFFEKDDEHRIMIDVSRGLLSIYENIVGVEKGPNIIIADFPLKWTVQGCSHLYDKGLNLFSTSQRALPAHLMEPKIKNRSRLFYLMANIEVSMMSGKDNWALLLDVNGNIAEGSGSNFFMIKNDVIYTPLPKDILIGITRNTIIEDIAPKLGIEVIQKDIQPFELYNADEAFLTSTPFCILPAVNYNNLVIGNGKPGKITKKLLDKWSEIVSVDIVNQIKKWDKSKGNNSQTTPYKFSKKS